MIRRWASLLVICASLLGLAAPTFACALKTHDCCPGGLPAPCSSGDHAGVPAQAATDCCSVAPPTSGLTMVDAGRPQLHLVGVGSSEPVIHPRWLQISQIATRARAGPPRFLVSYREDASLTYLRTARLRI